MRPPCIEAVAAAIEASHDHAAKPRLRRCLPTLERAIASWGGSPSVAPGAESALPLTLAAATRTCCVVLQVEEGWPQLPPETSWPPELRGHSPGEVALAVATAIDSSGDTVAADVIITGLTVVVGAGGLQAYERDAGRIVRGGQLPLVVALLSRQGDSVSVLVTTVATDRATLH